MRVYSGFGADGTAALSAARRAAHPHGVPVMRSSARAPAAIPVAVVTAWMTSPSPRTRPAYRGQTAHFSGVASPPI